MRPGQEEHDRLKAELPTGAACIADCPYCAESGKASKEERVSELKYDQETLDALVESALSKAAQEAALESDTKVAELQAQLEEKSEALVAAEAKVTELEGQIAEEVEKARLADVAVERASQVAEVTAFTEQQIEERQTAWAEMSEEAFAAMLEDFKSVTENARAQDDGDGKKKTPASKLSGTRETAGAKGTDLARLKVLFDATSN